MRISCLLLSALTVCSTVLPAAAQSLRIDEGTPVRLKLQEAVTAKGLSGGQKLRLTVLDDVTAGAGGPVLIKAGSSAVAFPIDVDETKGTQAGKVCIEISSTKAVDGTRVPLRGAKTKVGKGRARMRSYITGTLFGGPIGLGAVAYFGRKKDAVIPAGTVIPAFVDHDTDLSFGASSISSRSARLNVEGSKMNGAPVPGQELQLRGPDTSTAPEMREQEGGVR